MFTQKEKTMNIFEKAEHLLKRLRQPTGSELARRRTTYQADLDDAKRAGDLPPLARRQGNIYTLHPHRKPV
jgi:hypothetical protein